MKQLLNKILCLTIVFQLFSMNIYASEVEVKKSPSLKLDLNKIVLPSEMQQLRKNTGSIYYNQSVKGKVLVPVHFWGEFQRPGLHFVPLNSTLISGISMAGGPRTTGILESVKLTRRDQDKKIQDFKFDLTSGGELNSHNFVLKEGDTVFIQKSNRNADRSFYLGLIQVAITVLTTFVVVQKIEQN